MRTIEIEVLREDGWETVTVQDVASLVVAGAPGDAGLELTLIGQREGRANQIETGILDVADRHENLLDNSLPKTEDGTAVPVAVRDGVPESC